MNPRKKQEQQRRTAASLGRASQTGDFRNDSTLGLLGWLKQSQENESPLKSSLFQRTDWIAFAITVLVTLTGYLWTIAPDLTLEDSGELAVGSMYAGVPHPPGYPVWTLYTWLFTKLLPFSNIAWRVAVSSAVAASLSCGLLALLTTRVSARMLESAAFKGLKGYSISQVSLVCGTVAGLMLGFSGFMWSQAVIVEVYTLSVLSLMGVLCCLYRWMQATDERKYLYWSFFWFGICLCNHQTLIVAAMGIEVAILMARPRLGRDFFITNALVFVGLLVLKIVGVIGLFKGNTPMFLIFILLGLGFVAISVLMWMAYPGLGREWPVVIKSGLAYMGGASFYLYMPLAGMTNPPIHWGYTRVWEGFIHAFTRGQYQQTTPTTEPFRFLEQILMYVEGAVDEFSVVFLLLAIIPFLFLPRLKRRDGGWLVGNMAIYLGLAVLLLVLLNPNTDMQSREMTRVFFAASHVLMAAWIGLGMALLAGLIRLRFQQFRMWLVYSTAIAVGLALYKWVYSVETTQSALSHTTHALLFCLSLFVLALFLLFRENRKPAGADGDDRGQAGPSLTVILCVFSVMPVWSILAHWADNEQRGHLFGFWYGHDMFDPPFTDEQGERLYPRMTENAILFGGTDPGRFNPTYMIFCESFIDPEDRRDPAFDRRDVALITQNALADTTYLDTIRAHYQRSAQIDPPFIEGMLTTLHEQSRDIDESLALMRNPAMNPDHVKSSLKTKFFALLKSVGGPLARPFDYPAFNLGTRFEIGRRVEDSFFETHHFIEPMKLAQELASESTPLNSFIFGKIPAEFQKELKRKSSQRVVVDNLVGGFNSLLEGDPLGESVITSKVELSGVTLALLNQVRELGPIEPDPLEKNGRHIRWKQARTRLNRRILDEVFSGSIRSGKPGLYPDLEINIPNAGDATRAFQEYVEENQARQSQKALKPGERPVVISPEGHVQVADQFSVFQINSKLSKMIFDKNLDHDFFIEVSMPIEWMYPHLTPHGIILRVNREEVPEITPGMTHRDRLFWDQYCELLIGRWITDETPISELCAWAERTYLRWDFGGFEGDRAFVRDRQAQKAFSKLRGSIADVYRWRVNNARTAAAQTKDSDERQRLLEEDKRMTREFEFALKQAFAFCPYSPEVLSHYATLLLGLGQVEFQAGNRSAAEAHGYDAVRLRNTFARFDPESLLLGQLDGMLGQYSLLFNTGNAGTPPPAAPGSALGAAEIKQIQAQLQSLQKRHQANPKDPKVAVELAVIYLKLGDNKRAVEMLDALTLQTNIGIATRFTTAQVYQNLGQTEKGDVQRNLAQEKFTALQQKVKDHPEDFEAALDLAATHIQMGQNDLGAEVMVKTLDYPGQNLTNLLLTAQFFNQLGRQDQLERALKALTDLTPGSPEAWFDLSGVQAALDKTQEAMQSLEKALELDVARRKKDPKARNILEEASNDPRFTNVRRLPEFQKWKMN